MLTHWHSRSLAQALHIVCHATDTPSPNPIQSYSYYFSAVIPCLIGGGWNAYSQWNEHWEHWEHMTPLEERTEYPYQNIRSKNYPWGDGDKVSS